MTSVDRIYDKNVDYKGDSNNNKDHVPSDMAPNYRKQLKPTSVMVGEHPTESNISSEDLCNKSMKQCSKRPHSSLRSPTRLITPNSIRPATIDDFKYIKSCGIGTFGEVGIYEYKDQSTNTKKVVAIKKVFQNPNYKNREFSIQSQLNHRNIVRILVPDGIVTPSKKQAGCKDLNIVMECFDCSLYDVIYRSRKDHRGLNMHKMQFYIKQMLEGLSYLYEYKIAHRDLKPENILLRRDSVEAGGERTKWIESDNASIDTRVAICDFGNAKVLEGNEESISYVCTRMYRAPELVLGSVRYDCAVDMWSLGCIIVEMGLTTPLFGVTIEQTVGSDGKLVAKPYELWRDFISCLGIVTTKEWREMKLPEKAYELYRRKAEEAAQKHPDELDKDGRGLKNTIRHIFNETRKTKKVKRKRSTDRSLTFKESFPAELIDLISKMLKYSPVDRIKPKDALRHNFFKMQYLNYESNS